MKSLILFAACVVTFTVNAQTTKNFWEHQDILSKPDLYVRFDDIYMLNRDTGSIVSAKGKIYKTVDGGAHWNLKHDAGDTVYIRSIEFADDKKTGIAGSVSGKTYRTTDAGDTWKDISNSISDTGRSKGRICGLAHWGNTFYGVGWWGSNVARLYKSTDGGNTWQTQYMNTDITTGLVDITCIDANTIFASGGCYKNGYDYSVVIKSTDGGQSWSQVFSDSILGGRIWKIQFLDALNGYGSIEEHYFQDTANIIKTTDGGQTWKVLPVGKTQHAAGGYGTQGVGFLNTQHGWVGGYYDGLFETNDGGQTWTYLNDKTIYNTNRFFRVDEYNMFITHAMGAVKYIPFGTEVAQPGSMLSLSDKLSDVYPNPSDSRINIEFKLEHVSNVVIEVINIETRKTYHLTHTYLDKGNHKYTWDCSDKPTGNYLILVGTDDNQMTKKFTINR